MSALTGGRLAVRRVVREETGMSGTARAPQPPGAVNGAAAAVTLTYLGFTLQLLQTGIIPLLPAIGRQLHVTPAAASWLVTAGLLAGAVALGVMTRLADLIGKRPVILIALALVLAGCVLGSLTDNFALLVTSRVLMGAQLPMLALPEAIASDTMPPRRARITITAIHSGTGVGIAGGILLGALVGVHPTAWHWFFSIGAVTTLLGVAATVLTPYLLTFLVAFGVYGSLSAVTRFAQTSPKAAGYGWGFGAAAVALFAIPQALGAVAATPAVQALTRRHSMAFTTGAGMLSCTLAFVGFAVLHDSPTLTMTAQGLFAMGAGIALAGTQLMVLGVVPASESGIALGLAVVMYAVGNSLGSDAVGVLFSSLTVHPGLPALGSYVWAFWICGPAAALGVLL